MGWILFFAIGIVVLAAIWQANNTANAKSKSSKAFVQRPDFAPDLSEAFSSGPNDGLAIDVTRRKLAITRKGQIEAIFNYSSIIAVEVWRNGQTGAQADRGSQVLGAAVSALGPAGLLHAGQIGTIKHLSLKIYTNDLTKPVREVVFYKGTAVKPNSWLLTSATEQMEQWYGRLRAILESRATPSSLPAERRIGEGAPLQATPLLTNSDVVGAATPEEQPSTTTEKTESTSHNLQSGASNQDYTKTLKNKQRSTDFRNSLVIGFVGLLALIIGEIIVQHIFDDGVVASVAPSVKQPSASETGATKVAGKDTSLKPDSKENGNTFKEKTPAIVVDPDKPFHVSFGSYAEDGSQGSGGGGNLHVKNSAAVEYGACSIELGDGKQHKRWYLPKSTVIDANGERSYPTFLFRDRRGISPPTVGSVHDVLIRCSSPNISQEFSLASSRIPPPPGRKPSVDATSKTPDVPSSNSSTNVVGMSEEEMRDKMAYWVTSGQIAVKARLRDPGSVEWGELWFAWGVDGVPVVCGRFNAKNGFGGYMGMQRFISAGSPELTFFQSEVSDFSNAWELLCGKKNNDAAVLKWGSAAKIAPIRFR